MALRIPYVIGLITAGIAMITYSQPTAVDMTGGPTVDATTSMDYNLYVVEYTEALDASEGYKLTKYDAFIEPEVPVMHLVYFPTPVIEEELRNLAHLKPSIRGPPSSWNSKNLARFT